MNSKTKIEAIAYHEACHAVIAIYHRIPFDYATINPEPNRNSLGHVLLGKYKGFRPDMNNDYKTRQMLEKYIQVCLGGTVSEEKFTGKFNTAGVMNDFEICFKRAYNFMFPTKVAESFVNFMLETTKSLFYDYDFEEKETDSENWEKVKIVAKELLDKKTLSSKQVKSLL